MGPTRQGRVRCSDLADDGFVENVCLLGGLPGGGRVSNIFFGHLGAIPN